MITLRPKVTIVMPAYNCQQYIAEAIKSVLNETYRDFELIITDNFSSYATYEIAKCYTDCRIRVVQFRNFDVIAKSRNLRVKKSFGEIFAFLGADDF